MEPTDSEREGAIALCEEMARRPSPATVLPASGYPDEVHALARQAYKVALGVGEPSAATWAAAVRLLRSGFPLRPARWAIVGHGDATSCIDDPDQAAEVFVLNLPPDKLPHGARLQLQAVAAAGVTRVGPMLGYEVRRGGLGGFTFEVVPLLE